MSRLEVPLIPRTLRATGDVVVHAELVLAIKTVRGSWEQLPFLVDPGTIADRSTLASSRRSSPPFFSAGHRRFLPIVCFLNSARADAAASGCRRGRLDPPRSRIGVTIRSRPSPDARVAQPSARPARRGDRIRSPWTARARYAMHVLSTFMSWNDSGRIADIKVARIWGDNHADVNTFRKSVSPLPPAH